jgi:hypothetical protein
MVVFMRISLGVVMSGPGARRRIDDAGMPAVAVATTVADAGIGGGTARSTSTARCVASATAVRRDC